MSVMTSQILNFVDSSKMQNLNILVKRFFYQIKKIIQFMLLPTNCLGVFDHFVGLALEGLNLKELLSKRKS